jgi:hypothetical protein
MADAVLEEDEAADGVGGVVVAAIVIRDATSPIDCYYGNARLAIFFRRVGGSLLCFSYFILLLVHRE